MKRETAIETEKEKELKRARIEEGSARKESAPSSPIARALFSPSASSRTLSFVRQTLVEKTHTYTNTLHKYKYEYEYE